MRLLGPRRWLQGRGEVLMRSAHAVYREALPLASMFKILLGYSMMRSVAFRWAYFRELPLGFGTAMNMSRRFSYAILLRSQGDFYAQHMQQYFRSRWLSLTYSISPTRSPRKIFILPMGFLHI